MGYVPKLLLLWGCYVLDKVIYVSDIKDMISEVMGSPQELLEFHTASDSTETILRAYFVMNADMARRFIHHRVVLTGLNMKDVLSVIDKVSCIISSESVKHSVHGDYISVSDYRRVFLYVRGKSLLGMDEIVRRYSKTLNIVD